jgi:hypothetical protein
VSPGLNGWLWALALILPGVPPCGAVPTIHWVNPTDTDAAITNHVEEHYACHDPARPPRDRLFLFIPGTGALPSDYTYVVRTAADMGFNAIGLTYPNAESVNALCAFATNSSAFEHIRLEVLDGQDRTDKVSVTRTDSIENRLIKLLAYLAAQWPEARWNSFLSGTNLLWEKIVVAGHSQGGGHAGIIAKRHEVARCLMFDASDWWMQGRRPANWIYAAGATPAHRIFALAHRRDPIGTNTFAITWQAYGLGPFGDACESDISGGPPYAWSHQLWTDLETEAPGDDTKYHNVPVVDSFLPFEPDGTTPAYDTVWRFLMAGPDREPNQRLQSDSEGTWMLAYQTCTGVAYQVAVTGDYLEWRPVGSPVVGDETVRLFEIEPQGASSGYRLELTYE